MSACHFGDQLEQRTKRMGRNFVRKEAEKTMVGVPLPFAIVVEFAFWIDSLCVLEMCGQKLYAKVVREPRLSVLKKVTKVSVSEHFLRELEMFKSFLVRSGTAD